MSLARAIRAVLTDLDQLNVIHHQIQNPPAEVDSLFDRIWKLQYIIRDVDVLVSHATISTVNDDLVLSFQFFHAKSTALELFLDPEQELPRSGPGSQIRGHSPWKGDTGPKAEEFCLQFSGIVERLDNACKQVLSLLDQ